MATINYERGVVELYLDDLNEEAQKIMLESAGIDDPKEMNWDMDVLPIAFAAMPEPDDDEDDEDDLLEGDLEDQLEKLMGD